MKKQHVFLILLLWGALTAFSWFGPAKEASDSERRPLAQMPAMTLDSIGSGKFMKDFESYSLDQFPLRDGFRSIKALFHQYALGQKDNNGIYLHSGFAVKQEGKLNEDSVNHALERFGHIYDRYLEDSRIYLAVVPDKGYYLTKENGFPAMDYGQLMSQMRFDWAQSVDLTTVLSKEDYYRTDTHWRQEALLPTAKLLAQAMGQTGPTAQYTPKALERPFYGVYYGQAALPMQPDTMYIMESPALEGVKLTGYDDYGRPVSLPLYNLEAGDDLYDVFFEGSKQSLVVMENPNARTDKELVIFRDSFGCSLAPLLLEDYARITLVDLRTLSSMALYMVNYKDADVLFLYSTIVLNNPDSFRAS